MSKETEQNEVSEKAGKEAGQSGDQPEEATNDTPEPADETGQAADEPEQAVEESSLEDQVAELSAELDKARESALRAQAEAQNVRRRSESEVEKARKFALERFVEDLLPVVDNLDRALDVADRENEALKPVIEGIELTLKSFLDKLEKNKVLQIDPAGEPFDPEQHQAMTQLPNPDVEPNTVLEVFQKGYSLNGRLIRPAMVVVSTAAE